MIKLLLIGIMLFGTMGVSVAREILRVVGISDYTAIGMGGIVIAILLVSRGMFLLVIVGVMTIAISLSDDTLINLGLDKDVLIASILSIMLFPYVHKALNA